MAEKPVKESPAREEAPEDKYLQTLKQIKQLQKSLHEDGAGKQAAIDKLLARRNAIDEDLALLGYSEAPRAVSGSTGGGKGRPKGFKMTDEQKQRMREGRAKAKAEREAAAQTT